MRLRRTWESARLRTLDGQQRGGLVFFSWAMAQLAFFVYLLGGPGFESLFSCAAVRSSMLMLSVADVVNRIG